jgi:glycosyltransferase involved in cell wall biosynthesis
MARAVHERGHEVIVGGQVWPGISSSASEDHPFPIDLRTWPTARWMRRLLRETQPDLVHAHWMPIAFLAQVYGASPLVVSAWGSDVFRATRLQRVAWRLVARHADMVIGSSSALLRELEHLGAPRERTMLLNWGVDLKAFSPPSDDRAALRAALGLPAGPLILSPRSNGDVYNPRVILRAFERLAGERSDVTLVLLRARADDHGFGRLRHPERVHFVDHVPYSRMADFYRAADVCVSLASTDSSPRSVWEAMACGVPCVVSDIPWVHELIVDEEHALVVPIDEAPVTHAMRRLLQDQTLAARICANARQLVEEHRDRDRETERLCAVYEQVAEDGGRRSRLPRRLGPAAAAAGTAQAFLRDAVRRGGKRG